MNLFLLCAGEGTRFRPHTLERPKPAIPFLGIPLASYSLQWAKELPLTKTVINTYYLPEKLHAHLTANPLLAKPYEFSDEQPELRGSSGGLKFAESKLPGDPVLIMNGDEVFFPEREGYLREALEFHRAEKNLMTLIVMDYPGVGTQFGGIWTDAQNNFLGVGKNAAPGAHKGWHFIGPLIVSREIFSMIPAGTPANILYDTAMLGLQQKKNIRAFPVRGWWHEMGNVKDYLEGTDKALTLLRDQNAYASKFFGAMAAKFHPRHQWIHEKDRRFLLCEPNSSLELEGFGVVGEGVRGSGKIKNSVVGDGVQFNETIDNRLVL